MKLEVYKDIVLSIKEGLVFLDENLKVSILNEKGKEIFKTDQSAFEFFKREEIKRLVEKAFNKKKDQSNKNPIIFNKNYYDLNICPVISNKNFLGLIIIFKNINQRVKKYEETKELNYVDDLTKVYNRRYYEEQLKELNQKEYLPLTIIMIDVNNLKIINDVFKHKAGDKVLINISKIIKKNISSKYIFSRIGGDEFSILMPKTNEIEALNVISNLKKQISNKQINNIKLTCSFGFETKNNIKQNINKIIETAEDYMYKDKFIESENHKKEIIKVILNELYYKKIKNKKHSIEVSKICENFAEFLDLKEKQVYNLKVAGLLHDIGKIAINKNILKKEELTESEKTELKRHSEIGYNILKQSKEYYEIAEIVGSHHEYYDGSGYPKKLKKEEILIEARILSIVDEYFNLKTKKYKINKIKELLLSESNKKFDSNLLKNFIEFLEVK